MNYHETIYGSYEKSNYDDVLAKHLLKNYLNNGSVSGYVSLLDVGCGTGKYVKSFMKQFHPLQQNFSLMHL